MGQVEVNCLENVKKLLGGSTYHGITNEDFDEVRSLLFTATPTDNEHKTVFPDFVSDGGFVEHFAVSASNVYPNGGYTNKANEGKIKKIHAEMQERFDNEAQSDGAIRTMYDAKAFSRFNETLSLFEKSFKSHWESHIVSLHEYEGQKHLSCFMIESDDMLLVHEDCSDGEGLYYGNLVNERTALFCLAYDVTLLDFMYEYRDDIDYVIYFNFRGCTEIIKVANIPFLKKFLQSRKFSIASGRGVQMISTVGISIPDDLIDDTGDD